MNACVYLYICVIIWIMVPLRIPAWKVLYWFLILSSCTVSYVGGHSINSMWISSHVFPFALICVHSVQVSSRIFFCIDIYLCNSTNGDSQWLVTYEPVGMSKSVVQHWYHYARICWLKHQCWKLSHGLPNSTEFRSIVDSYLNKWQVIQS